MSRTTAPPPSEQDQLAVESGDPVSTNQARTGTLPRSAWARWRIWRRHRPFWAGLLTTMSGLIILFPPYASLRFGDVVVSLNTMGGISALIIGVVLVICGVSFWVRPRFRTAAGIVTLLLALAAIVTANLGSFLIGTLLGVLGAALGIAWSPEPKPAKPPKKGRSGKTNVGGGDE